MRQNLDPRADLDTDSRRAVEQVGPDLERFRKRREAEIYRRAKRQRRRGKRTPPQPSRRGGGQQTGTPNLDDFASDDARQAFGQRPVEAGAAPREPSPDKGTRLLTPPLQTS